MKNELLTSDFVYAIGWTLVHSLWLISIIAMVSFALIKLFRKPSAKHNIALLGLTISLIGVVVTFFIILKSHHAVADTSNINNIPEALTLIGDNESAHTRLSEKISYLINSNITLIVNIWLLGVLFFIIKSLGGYLYIERLKRTSRLSIPISLVTKFDVLKRKLNIRKNIEYLESSMIKVPMVVGHMKPLILLPMGLISGIPVNHLEAIIAHELGHIKRNDYLINIFKIIAELILFYHPLTWWFSRIIENERENCCDDISIQLTGNAIEYAKALSNLQEIVNNKLLPAPTLFRNKESLYERISRILIQKTMKSTIKERIIVPVLLLIFCSTLAISSDVTKNKNSENSDIYVSDTTSTSIERTSKISEYSVTDKKGKSTKKKKIKNSTTRVKISDNIDGKEVRALFKDDNLIGLKINGNHIPKKKYKKHSKIVKKIKQIYKKSDKGLAEKEKLAFEREKFFRGKRNFSEDKRQEDFFNGKRNKQHKEVYRYRRNSKEHAELLKKLRRRSDSIRNSPEFKKRLKKVRELSRKKVDSIRKTKGYIELLKAQNRVARRRFDSIRRSPEYRKQMKAYRQKVDSLYKSSDYMKQIREAQRAHRKIIDSVRNSPEYKEQVRKIREFSKIYKRRMDSVRKQFKGDWEGAFFETPEIIEMPEMPEMPEFILPELPEPPELPEIPEIAEFNSTDMFKEFKFFNEKDFNQFRDNHNKLHKEFFKSQGKNMDNMYEFFESERELFEERQLEHVKELEDLNEEIEDLKEEQAEIEVEAIEKLHEKIQDENEIDENEDIEEIEHEDEKENESDDD